MFGRTTTQERYTVLENNDRVAQLEQENRELRDQLAQLQSSLSYYQDTTKVRCSKSERN